MFNFLIYIWEQSGLGGKRLYEKQDSLNCVDTRDTEQPQMSGCDAHISKVSTPEAAQLTHRNTLSGNSRLKHVYQP